MNKSSVVFKTVKRQHSIIYDEHLIKAADHAPFSSVDCVMLSAVLKDGECGVEELILSRAKLGDKVGIRSLSDALEGNKSVLTLALSECDASWDSGLDQLFKVILTKNFNLRNLVLDRCGSAFGDGGGLGGALLVRDYFLNHFGGLVVLSLNSNCKTDVSGVMLGRALAENHLLEILQVRLATLRRRVAGERLQRATSLPEAPPDTHLLTPPDTCFAPPLLHSLRSCAPTSSFSSLPPLTLASLVHSLRSCS